MASPNGFVRLTPSLQPNGDSGSPWRSATDSPSRQLLFELGLQTDKINRDFHARLDQEALEREKTHRLALAAAAFEHERVRLSAERAQQLLQLQIERERQNREEEEQQTLDRERQEQVQREIAGKRREIEDAERLQQLKRAAAEAKQRAAEAIAAAACLPAQPQQTNGIGAAEAGEISSAPVAAAPAAGATESRAVNNSPLVHQSSHFTEPSAYIGPSRTINTSNTVPASDVIGGFTPEQVPNSAKIEHQRYLDVHLRLKQLRTSVDTLQDEQLKRRAGEYRREIRKSVGQLTVDMTANVTPYNKVRKVLNDAAGLQQPQIDIRSYIVTDIPPLVNPSQASAGLIQTYLLNIFAKAVVAQFINEAGVAPQAAEPIGTIAIRIFAAKEFRWQGISLIDILIAKFHAICPVLFGMYRISPATKKQRQGEALTGLGSGFAALSLRDFGKSTVQNPFPPSNYWHAMACIVNTPPKDVSQEHFIVLKAMIEHHATKLIRFFGHAAIVALRKAVIEFPQLAPRSAALSAPSSALSTLQATFRRDIHLTL